MEIRKEEEDIEQEELEIGAESGKEREKLMNGKI